MPIGNMFCTSNIVTNQRRLLRIPKNYTKNSAKIHIKIYIQIVLYGWQNDDNYDNIVLRIIVGAYPLLYNADYFLAIRRR